jgi:hypothetical protein
MIRGQEAGRFLSFDTDVSLVETADKEAMQPAALLLDVEGRGTRTGREDKGNKIYMQQSNHAQMFIPITFPLFFSPSFCVLTSDIL